MDVQPSSAGGQGYPAEPAVATPTPPPVPAAPVPAFPTAGQPAPPQRTATPTAAPTAAALTEPPLFGLQWPGPGRVAPLAALIAAGVAGISAAVALPWDRPGIGWLVTAAIAGGGTALAVRWAGGQRTGPPWVPLVRATWAVMAIALVAVSAVRAAGWLVLLCLAGAVLAGSIALTGGRSARGLALGVASVVLAALRALPWAARGLGRIRGRSGGSAIRTMAAVVVTLALLIAFAALFAAADAAFAELLGRVLPTVDAPGVVRWILEFAILALATLAACFLAIAPPTFDGDQPTRRPLRRIEWALPVGVLVVLFTGFVGVQLTVLFGGSRHVLVTAGLTYAEYARSGFWQLLVVTSLTLGVIAVAALTACRNTVADRAWLRCLLGALSALTLVIVASALSRMWAYEQAYGFTRLRLLVFACELWFGVVFLLVMAAGVRLGLTRARWIPGAIVGAGLVALLVLAVLNPDRLIAERNVDRLDRSGRIDLAYLSRLSADAVPALTRLPEPRRTCVLEAIHGELDGSAADAWNEWNFGRSEARRRLSGYTPPAMQQRELCVNMLRIGRD